MFYACGGYVRKTGWLAVEFLGDYCAFAFLTRLDAAINLASKR